MVKHRWLAGSLYAILAGASLANTSPQIKKFAVAKQLQGEQGIEQIILRGVAEDAEDGPQLKYEYRIVSGGGQLEPVKRYAIYHPAGDGLAVFELTVTDSAGAVSTATAEYQVGGMDPARLYTDRAVWEAALDPKSRKQAAFAFVERNEDLPDVLLIGDSISIGYTSYVREALEGRANVHRIPENGGDSAKALKQFDFWMGDKRWDIIHFNTGLHDMKRIVDNRLDISGEQVNSEAEYRNNLEQYFRRMTSTGARLIWASTTVVPEGAAGRVKGEEVRYNTVAEEVRQQYPSIGLNDLYALSAARPEIQKPANVHFEPEGSRLLGRQVAEAVLEALKSK
jgi:acyl-CoA thioesterase-1